MIWSLVATIGLPAIFLAWLYISGLAQVPPGTPIPNEKKAELHLLTALPIVWSEKFGLDQPKSAALERIELEYRVVPIDLPSGLPEDGLLLAAQPRALPAEELVALDAWVRRGGRLVLLADPMLEWPSDLPLGDARRAPPMYADTGLLKRWGLRLDTPEQRGPRQVMIDDPDDPSDRPLDTRVTTISPGRLVKESGSCNLVLDGMYAECPIGTGWAWVIPDADFLNHEAVQSAGGSPSANYFAFMAVLRAANSTR